MGFSRTATPSNPQKENTSPSLKNDPHTLQELQENWLRIQEKLQDIERRITKLEKSSQNDDP